MRLCGGYWCNVVMAEQVGSGGVVLCLGAVVDSGKVQGKWCKS